jgi:S-methylmethionine-dependent homocysteine/selenocysteine methylase
VRFRLKLAHEERNAMRATDNPSVNGKGKMVNRELLLLDGATGTELNRRGVDTGLRMCSANALTTDAGLNVLRQIHLDYLNAGADILTANTFRTHRRAGWQSARRTRIDPARGGDRPRGRR